MCIGRIPMDPAAPPSDTRITATAPPAPVDHPPLTAAARDVSVEAPSLWPRSAQWTTAALLGVVLLLLGIHICKGGRDKTTTQPPDLLLELNGATRSELVQIPGIGPALADRIVAYRRSNGPFRDVEDLRRVPGIGPATLQRLRTYVFVEPLPPSPLKVADADASRKDRSPEAGKRAAKSKKEEALAGQVI